MTDTPLYEAMREFIRAQVALEVTKSTAAEFRGVRSELETLREAQRSTPVHATQSIDPDAIATRAAALVPVPQIDTAEIVRQVVAQIPTPKDGENGKDATVNEAEIVARIAEIAIPRITAAIPVPTVDYDAIVARALTKIPVPKDGEDGLTSLEEVRAAVREEVALNQRSFYKGVFKEGTEYRSAEGVTWDGSMWLATRDTKAKPGTDDSWQLAVKRGRDGRK